MKIAIHYKDNDFSASWIEYCVKHDISYKIVNCYDSDIIKQLQDCDVLMWHFSQNNPKDVLFAKQLTFALQIAGKKVFPDFFTAWHFDDKVAQKYLMEALDIPIVPTRVFYEKEKALQWIEETEFPKVFKLRRGAGSAHVKLVENRLQAKQLTKKAFSRGFSQYDKIQNLKDRWYHYKKGKVKLWEIVKAVLRFAKTTEFARVAGPERGYIYFQDFIPDNGFDIRVIVIDGRAFAIKRLVREGDFRASGSGHILYERDHFNKHIIQLSFEVAEKVKSQSLAIDYVYVNGVPKIVELSYGFLKEAYYECDGFWDRDLKWHEGDFNAQGWMVEALINNTEPSLTTF